MNNVSYLWKKRFSYVNKLKQFANKNGSRRPPPPEQKEKKNNNKIADIDRMEKQWDHTSAEIRI